MVPTNFEDNIKEKLEARKLEPSFDSWKKLEHKLAIENDKPNSNKIWKLGLAAACIIGLAFVSTFVFEFSENPVFAPQIVDIEKNETLENIQNVDDAESSKKEVLTQPKNTGVQVSHIKEKKTLSETTLELKHNQINTKTGARQSTNEVVANNAKVDVDASKNETTLHSTLETQKVNDVVIKTQPLQNSNPTVTDAEIEALLKMAQKEIINQNSNNQSAKAVDANLLLQDIETELDISLRERVLKALTSGYKNVKTAVVERNN